jgi:hypothetical protein
MVARAGNSVGLGAMESEDWSLWGKTDWRMWRAGVFGGPNTYTELAQEVGAKPYHGHASVGLGTIPMDKYIRAQSGGT